jgi:hypothetical protein
VVSVQTANGAPAADAQVRVSAGAGLASDTLFAVTGANGTVVVDHVIIGNFSVRADSGNLSGTTTGSLAANEQKPVVGHLQATASIAGIVRAPNDAPVTEGTVTIGSGSAGVTVAIGNDGTFRADNLVFGSYTLVAYDAQNRVRAHVNDPIVLASPNQVAQTSMKFVGLGSVSGRVLNPNGSSASGLGVTGARPEPRIRWLPPGDNDERRRVLFGGGHPGGSFTVSVANPVRSCAAKPRERSNRTARRRRSTSCCKAT